ncbi:hypothetical protein, partial [Micromonospora sp. NPDC000018]|uniref:hypothetical protein n=1 Tax=Micromonospora sp. NPDC000018 TaxID=3154239 RepID=UPI003316B461
MTTETAPRIALPGGEMLAWSDLPEERLAEGGPLAALAARVVPAGARVLLAEAGRAARRRVPGSAGRRCR